MALAPVACPRCRRPFEHIPNWEICPTCDSMLHVEVFPALFRERAQGQIGEALLLEGESSCFYHPAKRAVLPCEGCGRFVCALCDCELSGRHFCPSCLEAGKTKGKIKDLENHRVLYDTIAMSLAVIPVASLVFWVFSIITAPMALFVAIRFWNAPRSVVRRSKMRYVIAIVFASVQIILWGLGIYYFYNFERSQLG